MSGKNSQKKDTTVIVAIIGLIGTLVAGLLASPLLPKLLGNDEETPPEVVTTVIVTVEGNNEVPLVRREALVFSNDFESGNATGFAFNSENWTVAKEKNNPLLEMSGLNTDSGIAVFGPNDFVDGSILFRINFRHFNEFLVNFRSAVGTETYTLQLSPLSSEIDLGYASQSGNWDLEIFPNGTRPFGFNEDTWYDVKLEVEGPNATIWVDENKLLTTSDDRLQLGTMEFAVQGDGTVWIDDVEVWQYTYEEQ